jgi:hypothetical protein
MIDWLKIALAVVIVIVIGRWLGEDKDGEE